MGRNLVEFLGSSVALIGVLAVPAAFLSWLSLPLVSFPAAWISVPVVVAALSALRFRFHAQRTCSPAIAGAVAVGSLLGSALLAVAWVVDADPSGRSNSPGARSFWIWLGQLDTESLLSLVVLFLLPSVLLVGAVIVGRMAGLSWRARAAHSRLAA
jgi:hypothetical protein